MESLKTESLSTGTVHKYMANCSNGTSKMSGLTGFTFRTPLNVPQTPHLPFFLSNSIIVALHFFLFFPFEIVVSINSPDRIDQESAFTHKPEYSFDCGHKLFRLESHFWKVTYRSSQQLYLFRS